jgi:hypothetical protein
MNRHLTKIIDNTKYPFNIINNFEEPSSMDNISSTRSYVSHYSRIIIRRRNQRELRHRTYASYPYIRLPVQVTNNSFANYIFNGSPTFH